MPGVTINNVGNASRKRSRRQDDGDDDENEDEDDVDVRQASSGLQSEPVSGSHTDIAIFIAM